MLHIKYNVVQFRIKSNILNGYNGIFKIRVIKSSEAISFGIYLRSSWINWCKEKDKAFLCFDQSSDKESMVDVSLSLCQPIQTILVIISENISERLGRRCIRKNIKRYVKKNGRKEYQKDMSQKNLRRYDRSYDGRYIKRNIKRYQKDYQKIY